VEDRNVDIEEKEDNDKAKGPRGPEKWVGIRVVWSEEWSGVQKR
jgi:hypothetical protein